MCDGAAVLSHVHQRCPHLPCAWALQLYPLHASPVLLLAALLDLDTPSAVVLAALLDPDTPCDLAVGASCGPLHGGVKEAVLFC